MSNYSIFLPSYSVGEECYKEIPYVTRKYGKKAVAIGGKTAMSKAKPELLKALEGTDFEITDFIWYGGDSNYENVEILKKQPEVINADMLFVSAADVPVIQLRFWRICWINRFLPFRHWPLTVPHVQLLRLYIIRMHLLKSIII